MRAPITIDWTGQFSGLFMLKAGRAGDPTPYVFDNYSVLETFTNVANGTTLIADRGRIRYTVLIDTMGDADLDNDVFLGDDVEPDVAGPHPVFVGVADFCDLLDVLR